MGLGGVLGRLRCVLEALWRIAKKYKQKPGFYCVFGHLGAIEDVFGTSCGRLGASWGRLGAAGGVWEIKGLYISRLWPITFARLRVMSSFAENH